MKSPEIQFDINLGVLGKQIALIGYHPDYMDVQYIIVDNPPLYLELEITTMDEVIQANIDAAIRIDAMERQYDAAMHIRDMRSEIGCRT